jgi:hypothetical protein
MEIIWPGRLSRYFYIPRYSFALVIFQGEFMPNYTENLVVMSGTEEEVSKAVSSLVKPNFSDKPDPDEKFEVDFEGLIPAPQFRPVPNAPEPNILHRALYGEIKKEDIEQWDVGNPEHKKIRIPKQLSKSIQAYRIPFVKAAISYLSTRSGCRIGTQEYTNYFRALIADVEAMENNLTRNGSPTLYDWMINNWGADYSCTVQVSAQSKGPKKYSTEIYFLTPWSGVFPVVSEFAKNNPKVLIEYLTTDEEKNYSMTYRFKKGQLVNAVQVKRGR